MDLSIIIPAYNEEQRLPETLRRSYEFLQSRGEDFEIIVVDDGSADGTAALVQDFSSRFPQVRLLPVQPNRGKGHAVKTGALQAQGRYVLFQDADGSTPIDELPRLMAALEQGAAVAIGSRAKAAPDTAVEARWYRKLPGRLLNWSINMFLVPGIADTQCGFKAFEAAAARQLFTQQQNERWSFDFELLYLARRAGLTIAEVPVNWRHVSGSKVNVLADGLRMLLDIAIIRWRHRGLGPGPS